VRVLALYDVHGNVDALDAVLAEAPPHDVVVVGGDAVPGPFAAEVVARLDGLPGDVRWLRGNGERECGEALGAPRPDPEDLAVVTAAASAAALGEARTRELAAAPLTLELDGALYCHASPRADDELLTRASSPERYATAVAGVTAPLVVAGHTHQADDRRAGHVRWVNAGSVGLPYEGDGLARWLLVTDGEPELRTTRYDHEAAGRRMLDVGWPDEASVRAALLDLVPAGEVTAIFEARVT
jgi:predicted phosphodiesterase